MSLGRLLRGGLLRALAVASVAVLPACGGGQDTPVTTLYVDETAPAGGDGSAEAPFRAVAEAFDFEGEGVQMIAIAPGSYAVPSSWTFPRGIILQGSIQSPTILTATQPASRIEWTAPTTGTLLLRDLAATSSLSITGGDVELQTVSVDGVSGPGLALTNATSRLHDLSIRNVTEIEGTPESGDGLVVDGGTVLWQRGATSVIADRGVVLRNTTATLSELTLGSQGRSPLTVSADATATATNILVSDAFIGVYVATNATLNMSESTITRISSTGLLASPGSTVVVTDSVFSESPQGHLSTLGSGTKLTLEGNTFTGATASSCISVNVTDGGVLIRDNVIDTCAGSGVSISDVPAATIDGNELKNILPDPIFPEVATAITVIDSTATITGNRVHLSADSGIGGIRATLDARDNNVGPVDGAGISLIEAGTARSTVSGNMVTGATGVGIISLGAAADVTGNTISGTLFNPADSFGDGIAFGDGADLTVTGNTTKDNARNGIVFLDGATGEIMGNTATGNAQYGILEFCTGAANSVTVGTNTLTGNTLGEQSLCSN